MSRLVFGVRNVAYTDAEHPESTTTYQVAKILEDRYDVMGVFYKIHHQEIIDRIAKRYLDRVKDLMDGKPSPRRWPMERIDSLFRDYLSADEWQSYTGETIQAAQKGRSSRKKAKKYATGRPAFIDSGLYRRSFRSWIER